MVTDIKGHMVYHNAVTVSAVVRACATTVNDYM